MLTSTFCAMDGSRRLPVALFACSLPIVVTMSVLVPGIGIPTRHKPPVCRPARSSAPVSGRASTTTTTRPCGAVELVHGEERWAGTLLGVIAVNYGSRKCTGLYDASLRLLVTSDGQVTGTQTWSNGPRNGPCIAAPATYSVTGQLTQTELVLRNFVLQVAKVDGTLSRRG